MEAAMKDADRLHDRLGHSLQEAAADDLRAGDRLLIVVRHGDAGDKRRWEGPDRLRPLSPTGCRQAEGLLIRLDDYPVERILTSPTVRCRQTVEPLARDRLLPVEPVAALGVDAGPAELRTVLSDWRLHDTVLCTHGETISQLFRQLAMDRSEVEQPPEWPKGSTWLLRYTGLRVSARYLPPLALDPVLTR
jgi:8-oxo-dGTP diphosphatase